MKEFTSEEIQAQFDKLPEEVKAAVTSTDVNDKIEAIGKNKGLLIDQVGELVDEIGLVMMGLRKAEYFIPDLCSRLSISRKAAEEIAKEVNTNIFNSIKRHLMEMQDNIPDNRGMNTQQSITDLERIGEFTLEKTAETNSNDTTNEGMYVEGRPAILEGIENPQPAKRTIVSNTTTKTEPLVDHLLTTPTIVPPVKTEVPKTKGPDPYREQVN